MGHIIPHGVFTPRKLDGNPWMPDFYAESPTFPWMHLWNEFSTRASYINSLGNAAPDVLLYNPMETVWMLSNIDMVDVDMWTFSDRNPNGPMSMPSTAAIRKPWPTSPPAEWSSWLAIVIIWRK